MAALADHSESIVVACGIAAILVGICFVAWLGHVDLHVPAPVPTSAFGPAASSSNECVHSFTTRPSATNFAAGAEAFNVIGHTTASFS